VGPVRIAFLSSEVAPFAKTGGLADVALSLPRALARLGRKVRVFMPLYGFIDRDGHS
jgi:starch synthase